MLLVFSLLAAVAVLVALLKLGRKINATTVALALILGGALGNAYDRMRFGYVIDFLEVHIIHYHWPDFNVADSAIVVGGMLLLFDALFSGKEQLPMGEPVIRNHHGYRWQLYLKRETVGPSTTHALRSGCTIL